MQRTGECGVSNNQKGMLENFLQLQENVSYIKEAHRVLSSTKKTKPSPKYAVVKLQCIINKETIPPQKKLGKTPIRTKAESISGN